MNHLLSIHTIFLFSFNILFSQIINVPDDQATIQEAINASVDGDTVLVANGTYYENIDYNGKAVTVASHFILDHDTTHITQTIINGSNSNDPVYGAVVTFNSGEDIASVLCGFTITGGKGNIGLGHQAGGGIAAKNSGGKVIFNKIIYNSITYEAAVGGGIVIYNPSSIFIISNNIIAHNEERSTTYTGGGGGIHIGEDRNGRVIIANNYIARDKSSSAVGRGAGGGIDLNQSCSIIKNNIIVFNESYQGGGLDIWDGNELNGAVIENNTIAYNHATSEFGGGILDGADEEQNPIRNCILWGNTTGDKLNQISKNDQESDIVVEYSLVQGGYDGIGNIDVDPIFTDTLNFNIDQTSPCVDAGNPGRIFNDLTDPNNPGFPLFPALGGLRNDMGAYGGNPIMIYAQAPRFFIRNCTLNNTYQVPGSDTLIVTSKIFSPEDQSFKVQATIASFDNTINDSIQMVDNGVYPDNITGDGIFSGFWSVPNSEEDFDVRLSAYFFDYEYLVLLDNAANFTTKGPIVLDRLEITTNDTIQNPGERFKFSLTLSNLGITDTVNNVYVKIIIPDTTNMTNTTTGTPKFGDIAPGESLTSWSRDFAITLQKDGDSCFVGEYEIGLEIISNSEVFWYDTFTIDVESITNIEDEQYNLPKEFVLRQNYPNPFNPSTKIKYSISAQSIVMLKIFDVLGREVSILVNEEKATGHYEIDWDAGDLTSGIYFYRIKAGDFVETKKMILMK